MLIMSLPTDRDALRPHVDFMIHLKAIDSFVPTMRSQIASALVITIIINGIFYHLFLKYCPLL